MKRRITLVFAASVALAAVSCSKRTAPADGGAAVAAPRPAGPPAWQGLLAHVPGSAVGVFIATDIRNILEGARGALARLKGTTAGIFLEEVIRMARHKMAMGDADVFDLGTWKRFGFELDRGFAAYVDPQENEIAIFGVADPAKVEPLLRSYLEKAGGASAFQAGPGITLAKRADGSTSAAYGFAGGYGYLTGTLRDQARAAALLEASMKPAQSILQSPELAQMQANTDFTRGVSMILFERGIDAEVRKMLPAFRGMSLRLVLLADRVDASAHVAIAPHAVDLVKKILPGGSPASGLTRLLGADTLLAAAGKVDLQALFDSLMGLVPPLREAVRDGFERLKKKLDIDIDKELFQNLTGDGALGIHKIEASLIPAILAGGLREVLASDPFHLSLFLKVRDPAVAGKFLKKMAILSDTPLEKVGTVDVFPVPVSRLLGGKGAGSKKGAALRFALLGDMLAMTTGRGRMEKAVEALQAKDGGFLAKVLDPETRKQLEATPAPVAYVLGSTLTENLREVEGALLKSKRLLFSNIVQKVTEVVERIADVSFGGEAVSGGVRAWLRLRLR